MSLTMTLDEARAALPGWWIGFLAQISERGSLEAREPNYQVTGITIHADDPAELVERARAFVAVVELAAGRPASRAPTGERILRALPAHPPAPTALGAPKDTAQGREHARSRGYDGASCGTCGSLSMRRAGVCLVCDDCGTTTGCS